MTTATTTEAAPPGIDALRVLGSGLAVGLAGDLLFRGSEGLGPNLVIVILLTTLAAAALARDRTAASQLPDRWLLTAIGFASCLMLRDAEFLRAMDVLALITALSLTSLSLRVAPRRGQLRDYVATGARAAGMAIAGPLLLLSDDGGGRELSRRGLGKTGPVVLGAMVAVPIVIVFAALFAEADPVFGNFVRAITSSDLGPIVSHAGVILGLGWLTAGLLKAFLWEPRLRLPDITIALSPVTVGVVVGSMTAVFVLFVASQARFLFGGVAFVESVPGLTYAEHARRGFFEMVAASALAVPVLYAADTALAGASAGARHNFRSAGSIQLLLIGVVMASAFHRVALYISMYGLTSDRFVGMAVLVWLAVVLGWFAATVLRGRPERFTFGAVVSGFVVLGLLNAVNPEAVVTRVNTRRAPAATALDDKYLLTLSADAVPALTSWLEARPAVEQCRVGRVLRGRWIAVSQDWRSWNRATARARDAVRAAGASTTAACRTAQPPPQ